MEEQMKLCSVPYNHDLEFERKSKKITKKEKKKQGDFFSPKGRSQADKIIESMNGREHRKRT